MGCQSQRCYTTLFQGSLYVVAVSATVIPCRNIRPPSHNVAAKSQINSTIKYFVSDHSAQNTVVDDPLPKLSPAAEGIVSCATRYATHKLGPAESLSADRLQRRTADGGTSPSDSFLGRFACGAIH
eukprot:TRINITY_DN45178_c0_g3_i2.p2 TRINITY_DN45178_c0_g3~~TRINITY_DN45178_c0_g3_i2.p2  ORF type:complete len:126 (-),score=0.41 TRINITY_DN45178_c0_g3_i2:116-493(-)